MTCDVYEGIIIIEETPGRRVADSLSPVNIPVCEYSSSELVR